MIVTGLYIRNRRSELIKVAIPSDHIAFQIGETAQVQSGGILQVSLALCAAYFLVSFFEISGFVCVAKCLPSDFPLLL